MADSHQKSFLDRMAGLLGNQKYSDLTIECEGHRFFVNKAVVCPHSPIIDRECMSQMQEGLTNIIKHETFDRDTVSRMLAYMYRQTYDVEREDPAAMEEDKGEASNDTTIIAPEAGKGASNSSTKDPNSVVASQLDFSFILLAHADVYGIADHYDIPTLKQLALENFEREVKRRIKTESFLTVFNVVQQLDGLVYKELRSILGDLALAHRHDLVTTNGVCAEQLASFTGMQEFALDLMNRTILQHKESNIDIGLRMMGVYCDNDDLQRRLDKAIEKRDNLDKGLARRDRIEEELVRIARDMEACNGTKAEGRVRLNLERKDCFQPGDGKGFYKITCVTCGVLMAS